MTKESTLQLLIEMPETIKNIELEIFRLDCHLREHKFNLERMKAELLLQQDSPIDGKNETMREAQLLQNTASEKALVLGLETDVARKKIDLRFEQAKKEIYILSLQLGQVE